MKATKLIAILLLVCMMLPALASCGGKKSSTTENPADGVSGHKDPAMYTYHDYTTLSPSNWNELTYKDNNDTQIMSYIGSSFFSYDYEFDANGEIVPGSFTVIYNAASALTDVTAEYAEAWGLPADGSGYAWKITLRHDLKWENGDAIKAEDFVYTMKEQLAPEFQNYRADSFYVGSTIIHNAENYVKQGQTAYGVDNSLTGKLTMADLVKGEDGVYTQADGKEVYFAINDKLDYVGATVYQARSYLDADAFAALFAIANEEANKANNYRIPVTDETIALWTTLINTEKWGFEGPECLPYYLVYTAEYAETAWEDVGIFADPADPYSIVLVLDSPLPLLKEDGSLAYYAAYNMSSLPLVHKATYDACKVPPAEEGGLWTSTYNSSKETTMSWGPYKLSSFQTGKQYTLDRNENWYGYNMPENDDNYQTDSIVCDTIEEYNTAFAKFLSGEIDGIGIQVDKAPDYKGSERAYYTPDDYVASLQLQSDAAKLKERETAGVDKEILADVNFRKALSLAIDRADFTKETTTSSLAGFGLFNSMHYYDVENGKAYRESDDAKAVLCAIYGVNPADYPSLDDAVDSITGYDLNAARALVTEAYNKALAEEKISATDVVVLTMGSGAINEIVQKRFDYIAEAWTELMVGTPLEGRIEFEVEDFADAWADDFRAGAYDVCMGGWTGAAWDPGYFLLAYLSPSYMFSAAWDTSSTLMTFTMKGVPVEQGGETELTMSLMDWYACLNGSSGAAYNWSKNALPQEQRLQLIAALEQQVLQVYYSVPLYNNFSASMLSYKVDYITYEYNTFMGYGGIKYMTYNYDDAAWAQEVANQGGSLDYKG